MDGTLDGASDGLTVGCSDGISESLVGTSDCAMLDGVLERYRDGSLVGEPDELSDSGTETCGFFDGKCDSEGLLDGGLTHLTPLQIRPGQHCGEAFLYVDPHCLECLRGREQFLYSSKEEKVSADV